MSGFWIIFRSDLLVAVRFKSDSLHPLLMFLLLAFLSTLVVHNRTFDTSMVAVGSVWLAAMIANLLALETLFNRDAESGMVDQFLVHSQPLFLVTLGRVLSRWLLVGLPICLLSPVAALLMGLHYLDSLGLAASLFIATPALTALGVLGSALSIGIERGGVLLAILILPLYLPVYLLGVGFGQSLLLSQFNWSPLLWLTAISIGAITVVPFAIGFALKISQEY